MTHEEQIPDAVNLEHVDLEHVNLEHVNLEHNVLEQLLATPPSGFGCPDCGGSLWQIDSGSVKRYQCHVGHAFLAESLIKTQGEEIERHLWIVLRLLREQVIATRQLAAEARSQKRHAQEIEQLEAQVERSLHQAEQVRQVLLSCGISAVLETGSLPPQSDSSLGESESS